MSIGQMSEKIIWPKDVETLSMAYFNHFWSKKQNNFIIKVSFAYEILGELSMSTIKI
jgi:hypothetical protein